MSTSSHSKSKALGRSLQKLRSLLPASPAACFAWGLAPMALVSSLAVSDPTDSTPPAIPPIDLASIPLHSQVLIDKPTLLLALSVEFPTAGAQYTVQKSDGVDDTYENTKEYLGYYNAESCYQYN